MPGRRPVMGRRLGAHAVNAFRPLHLCRIATHAASANVARRQQSRRLRRCCMTQESADAGQTGTSEETPTPIPDIMALLGVVELVSVRFLEVSAKRLLDESRKDSETAFDMQFFHRQSSDRLDLRFRMTAEADEADYVVD